MAYTENALENLSFVGQSGQTFGSTLINVFDSVRGSSGEVTVTYDIHNSPIIAHPVTRKFSIVTYSVVGKLQ